ncbi:class I SAM-dependent methyltransferase [Sulfurimonas sp.]|uniref:class I SAM-dependent methyltransferase n=1 Tax=Sulfurimonas sp. TaxID=2022749 RepID=UPI003561BCB0
MEITDKKFWKDYWGEIKLPNKLDWTFKNDRVIGQTIIDYIPVANKNQKALEIGCAPGKWLIFLYEKLNYEVDGFEYVDIAAEKTRENLLVCKIPESKFNIITADFLTQLPVPKYDVVTSFGFLEHFDNYEDIFNKHLQYTKKDGYVAIGFPNFRGINYYIQLFIDKISGSCIIENHNINMMDKGIMRNMIKNENKQEIFIDYIGGFEPALFNTNNIKNSLVRFFFKAFVKSFSYIFNNTNNKYIASYLILIVKND